MPIASIQRGATERFPSLGILRKGAPKPDDRHIGKDLQHFRFSNPARPELETLFRELYGERPAELHVYLPGRTLDDNYMYYMEEWVAGGLMHRCDGETMTHWRTPHGQYSSEPLPCPYATGDKTRTPKAPGCKPVGRLRVLLPEFLDNGFVGDVTLLTGSWHDIQNILNALMATEAQRGNHPMGLRGIQFILRRHKAMISTPGQDGRRARREKWLTSIEPAQQWVRLQIEAARNVQYLTAGATLALPAGVAEDEDLDERVAGDPDSVEGQWADHAPNTVHEDDEDTVDGEWEERSGDPGYGETAEEPPEAEAPAPQPAPRAAATPEEPEAPPWEGEPAPAPAPRANGNGHNGGGATASKWATIPARSDGFTIPVWFEPDKERLLEARDVRVTFGNKHPGKSIGQIDDMDVGYIAWLTTKYEPRNDAGMRVQWAARYVRSYRMWGEQQHQLPMDI